jgi:hypothetical protein
MPINEQMELDTLTFALLAKDAFCLKMQETQEGKDYLEKCWRYQQTTPDIKTLREQFN